VRRGLSGRLRLAHDGCRPERWPRRASELCDLSIFLSPLVLLYAGLDPRNASLREHLLLLRDLLNGYSIQNVEHTVCHVGYAMRHSNSVKLLVLPNILVGVG
jgi:hypothetical protein